MGLLSKLGNALIKTEKAIGAGYRTVGTVIPQGYDFASGTQFLNFIALASAEDGPKRITVTSPYLQNSWVYSAIRVMATNFSQMEWQILTGEDTVVEDNAGKDGWVPHLFNYVSPQENRYSLWEAILVWLAVRGECFWNLVRNGGRIVEIETIPPDIMEEQIVNGKLSAWKTKTTPTQYFPAEDVIQFKYFNPYNKWRGLSPLTAAGLGIHVDFAASLYNYFFFNNDSTPAGVIKTDQELTNEEADAMRIRWIQQQRGLNKKGNIAVFGKGGDYKPIALAQKDIQYIEQKKWSREEVFAVLEVPPALSQVLEFASIKSNIKEQRQQLFENNLIPKKKFIEDVMRTQFFGRENLGHLRGEFDLSGVSALKETIAEKIGSATALFNMGVPLNAINEKLELGFEEFDWGDQGYISGMLVPAGEEPPVKEVPVVVAPSKEPPPEKSI